MAGPLITLTTDFGTEDPYVGVMKGVILGINPHACIVDVTHHVRPQAVEQAAFLISRSVPYFPPDTIHVVVVDPGVGTSRRALLLETPMALFIGPDNGVLSCVLPQETAQGSFPLPLSCHLYSLDRPQFWHHPISQTFHGRDIFAPVAAHLSLGARPQELGTPYTSMVRLPRSTMEWHHNALQGRVVHVDRFGNLVTDIEAGLLAGVQGLRVEIGGRTIHGLSRSYAEDGDLLAIIGSYDTLEVAVRKGNASAFLGCDVGASVLLSLDLSTAIKANF